MELEQNMECGEENTLLLSSIFVYYCIKLNIIPQIHNVVYVDD